MSADRHQRIPDVIVVGGGVMGCALAYDLTGHGLSVQIVERRELAREASWASAGIISPPVPTFDSRLGLALATHRRYPTLVRDVESMTGIATGFTVTGEIMAVTDDDEQAFRDLEDWQQAQGIATEWLDGLVLREREPALHDRFTAGLLTPDTASIRLDRFTFALAKAAELRGASLREFTTVTGVTHSGGRASGVQTLEGSLPGGAVVIAAGAWSGSLTESLDFSVPTNAILGQMLAIANPPVRIRHIISGGGGYIVPRADGTVAVGATVEPEAGFDVRVTPAGVAWLADLIDRVAPTLNHGTLESTWAGLRPGTADGELVVGRLPHLENVWVATGHSRAGALLCPATSELLAGSIAGGADSTELAAFSPARFA